MAGSCCVWQAGGLTLRGAASLSCFGQAASLHPEQLPLRLNTRPCSLGNLAQGFCGASRLSLWLEEGGVRGKGGPPLPHVRAKAGVRECASLQCALVLI